MLHASEIVAGDIIQIVEGINIPCDGFIIRASDVKTDESAMTGETDPVKKDTLERCLLAKGKLAPGDLDIGTSKIPSPIILSGTKIMIGEGLFIVIVVGEDSCVGKIRSTL
jgi:magnesium-transporting ATPase (P-type)